MYNWQENYQHYREFDLTSQVATASPYQLVMLLFNGLMDELVKAKSHITEKRYDRKVQSINKSIDILNALTSTLDFEQGGEIALNLAALYDHCVHRLYEASDKLSISQIEEVEVILNNIKEGWSELSKRYA